MIGTVQGRARQLRLQFLTLYEIKMGNGFRHSPFLITLVKRLLKYQTQPVGLGKPAILQAPLPGPDGNSS